MSKVRDRTKQAHRSTVESEIADIVGFLEEVLTKKLVAYMTGHTDPKTVARWSSGERTPKPAVEAKLRTIYQVFQLLQAEESPHTVRAWFVGLNPQLDDVSPATALREDRDREVLVAARSYITGG